MSEYVPLVSSVVRAIDWENGVLTVFFRNGAVHPYPGIPYGVFQTFANAPSPGRFYNAFIKLRRR